MFERFLMVCVGNICRSPMAEALLQARLRARGIRGVVESAGIAAMEGEPAHRIARELMRERGLDLSGHRSRQVTPDLLDAFELVLTMEKGQRRVLEEMHPPARGRVQVLGRFGGFEIPDPAGGNRAEFERVLALIERGVGEYERALWKA